MSDVIDELERLHAAATCGTWRVHDNPRYWAELPDDITEDGKDANRDANAAFVVASHNHLPALLAYVRAAESLRDEVGASLAPFGERVASAVAALDAARAKLNGGK